jgi:abhydrolase domain-containing protein 17
MNGLSLSDLCCLFCCPPLPSRIVAKLAFLPPSPTYKLIVNDTQEYVNQVPPVNQDTLDRENEQTNVNSYACNLYNTIVCKNRSGRLKNEKLQNIRFTNAQLQLNERAEWQYSPIDLEKLEVFLCKTEGGHKIACMHIKCTNNPKYTILFSHGNAVDLGQMSSFYYGLGVRLECNIFTYDYSGYGASEGKPNEQNLYTDIKAAWNALRTRYNVSPLNIIMYGQSIGTVPTVDLASKVDCGGIVLHAPLMSGMRVAFNTKRTWCCDAFPSIDKVNKIGSLVLVIHGTDDEVIDMSHGVAIHQKCKKPVGKFTVFKFNKFLSIFFCFFKLNFYSLIFTTLKIHYGSKVLVIMMLKYIHNMLKD